MKDCAQRIACLEETLKTEIPETKEINMTLPCYNCKPKEENICYIPHERIEYWERK